LLANESTLNAELNDFGAQPALLGGQAADSDGWRGVKITIEHPGVWRDIGDVINTHVISVWRA
jgi:hypothetical protein